MSRLEDISRRIICFCFVGSSRQREVATHIDENTRPIKNGPKTLSMRLREGIITRAIKDHSDFARSDKRAASGEHILNVVTHHDRTPLDDSINCMGSKGLLLHHRNLHSLTSLATRETDLVGHQSVISSSSSGFS
jgi:hypothetical protein